MDKNKNCGNYKNQQNCKGCKDAKPIQKPSRVEIHLPDMPQEEDFVTIPIDEYADLVATATYLEIIERWAKAHSPYDKVQFNELLLLLGVEEDK